MDVAKEVSKSLSERVVIAKVCLYYWYLTICSNRRQVNGELWDLERPLEGSCKLELLDFEHPEGMLECQTSATRAEICDQARKYSGTLPPMC
jgi:hypothetical protein